MTGDSIRVDFELLLEARMRLEGIVSSLAAIPPPAAEQFPEGIGASAAVAERFGGYATWWTATAGRVRQELAAAVQAVAAAQAEYQRSDSSIATAATDHAR